MDDARDEALVVEDSARPVSHAGRQVLAFVTAAATIGALVAGMVLPVAWFATGVTREVTSAVGIVPEEVDVRPLPQRSTILDADGEVLAHVFEQNRVSVPLTEVSRNFVKALLAVEDSRFYDHSGIDLQGTRCGHWSPTSGRARWCRVARA
jgi:membrane peptidoglycan carboxypeptidase